MDPLGPIFRKMIKVECEHMQDVQVSNVQAFCVLGWPLDPFEKLLVYRVPMKPIRENVSIFKKPTQYFGHSRYDSYRIFLGFRRTSIAP